MKIFLWLVGGLCAAAALVLLRTPQKQVPVQELAQKLESAWASRNTVV